MEKHRIYLLFLIALVAFYHIAFHNCIEKAFVQTHMEPDSVLRPICENKDAFAGWQLSCIGLPSGHAESAAVLSILLMANGLIAPWMALAFVIVVSAQRIIARKHTLGQVLTGAALGGLYAAAYYKSLWIIVLVVLLGFLMVALSIRRIDSLLAKDIPNWVDPVMYSAMKKKRETGFFNKFSSILTHIALQEQIYMSWPELEEQLDILAEKLRGTGIRWDGVVGIKTGGAIISDYLSRRLGVPNYKVKISKSRYKCNKSDTDFVYDYTDVITSSNIKDVEFQVCEPINEDLTGKNLILLDELVVTGRTMDRAYDYLIKEKRAARVHPTSVSFRPRFYIGNLEIDHLFSRLIATWPWGYDN